ncbi:MAG: magnesium-translocating P-type ATPase, partial [Tissierellia bacterium]|nr:magnesium-translocating P-type ATPase [Tissierellia bacterium]
MMKNLFDIDYFDLASRPLEEIKEWFKVKEEGHSEESAAGVREEYGDNEIDYGTDKPLWKIVVEAYFTPFTLVLFALALVSFLTDFIFVPVEDQE